MLREIKLILSILGLCALGSALIIPVHADLPAPCEYYGGVTLFGMPAPAGSVVVAAINGQERGRITLQLPGQYGSTCIFGTHLKVQPTEEEYANEDILFIDFFVNGMKADESSVYHPGVIRWQDLTVTRVPTPVPTPTEDPLPIVMFNATPRAGYAPLQVAFTDLTSAGAGSWSWDLGDGTHSGDQHPAHLYRFPGNYSVNLTISTSSGQSWLRVQDCIQVVEAPIQMFPNQTSLPTDPDNDGFYEDLNGNDHIEFDDLYIYFSSMEWIGENLPVNPFDYNLNGRVDFDDLYSLFLKI
ncbi:MAG: PKD domain-containing protein [Methanolinea sp.]|jgi:PKD repeat protein|nr:PKD domain-containing protein [Methanolinea sp.]